MRKRLLKLTGALLISGASTVALAMPASAAVPTVTATKLDATLVAVTPAVSSLIRYAETNTGTTTGTYLADFGSVLVATISR